MRVMITFVLHLCMLVELPVISLALMAFQSVLEHASRTGSVFIMEAIDHMLKIRLVTNLMTGIVANVL
jgi:hypothetical protein